VKRDPFFAVMAGTILLLVLGGFTPTLYLRPLFRPMPIPVYLYVHGIVLTAWFAWFFVQTLLVQVGRTAVHRKLGVVGAVLAAVIPFAGLMATLLQVSRVVSLGIDLDADASVFVGLGLSGIPVKQFEANLVFGNLSSVISFAVLAWTGILLRKRAALHKRLMLLATIAIVGPALARLSRLSIFGASEQSPFQVVVVLALVGAVIVHDVITLRKIKLVTVFGAALPFALFFASIVVAQSDFALGFIRLLQ
jgi:hypothetical protein